MRGLILAGLVLLAGCSGTASDGPPAIRYGKDLCTECRMILGEERFAAALADQNGEILKFDDIGCMNIHQSKAGGMPKNFWVHDYADQTWIDGKKAFFVRANNLATPMGYGIAASSSRAGAQDIAEKQGGRVVSWEEMPSLLQKRGRDIHEEGR